MALLEVTPVATLGAHLPAAAAAQAQLQRLDRIRLAATERLDPASRAALGQFLTPAPVASLMAGMFAAGGRQVHVLDPGAGIGTLAASLVLTLCGRTTPPERIDVTAYEIDLVLVRYLQDTFQVCAQACAEAGIMFVPHIEAKDFLADGVDLLRCDLFSGETRRYSCVVMNPPYHKIHSASVVRMRTKPPMT